MFTNEESELKKWMRRGVTTIDSIVTGAEGAIRAPAVIYVRKSSGMTKAAHRRGGKMLFNKGYCNYSRNCLPGLLQARGQK